MSLEDALQERLGLVRQKQAEHAIAQEEERRRRAERVARARAAFQRLQIVPVMQAFQTFAVGVYGPRHILEGAPVNAAVDVHDELDKQGIIWACVEAGSRQSGYATDEYGSYPTYGPVVSLRIQCVLSEPKTHREDVLSIEASLYCRDKISPVVRVSAEDWTPDQVQQTILEIVDELMELEPPWQRAQ